MKSKRKSLQRVLVLFLVMVVTGGMTCTESFAYFQRGTVSLSLGASNVTVNQGSNTTVSVSFSPSRSKQLPGCGMAECPQTCGEKECLDANGECTCNGMTYTTYYAAASVSSSNTSVATATYGGGTVSIKGVSPGSATITVTSALRQFTGMSKTISVTVNKPESSSASSSSNDNSSSGVSIKEVEEKDLATTKINTEEKSTFESDKGEITFVEITSGKIGEKELKKIKGKEAYVVFQKTDKTGTVLYSWEFMGEDINDARDIDLRLQVSREPFEGCSYGTESNSIYIIRSEEDELPGKASTFINVVDWFDNKDALNLYAYDDGEVQLLEEDLKIDNGYVTSEAMYGDAEQYILTTEKWDAAKADVIGDEGGMGKIGVIIGIIVVAAAAASAALMRKRKLSK